MRPQSSLSWSASHVVVTPAMPELRPPGMGAPLRLTPARTALVLVDIQNFFVETEPFSAMGEVVAPLAAFLPVARAAGMAVVHVRTEFDEQSHGLGREGSRTRQMIGSVAAELRAGSHGAAPPSDLRERDGEPVVIKTRFSGFWGTTLDAVLRGFGVDTLVFAGGTTTVCVESTLRDAVFLEYNPLLLTDCVRDISPDLHESAVHRIDLFFGWTCSSTALGEALRALGGGHTVDV